MKFIGLIFLVTFFASASFAQNASEQEVICKTSPACQQACDQNLIDQYQLATPKQQQLILKCVADMSSRYALKLEEKDPTKK
jgi:hypothetical protein